MSCNYILLSQEGKNSHETNSGNDESRNTDLDTPARAGVNFYQIGQVQSPQAFISSINTYCYVWAGNYHMLPGMGRDCKGYGKLTN